MADWENTFAAELGLRAIARPLRERVDTRLRECGATEALEGFGCPQRAGACTHKLSSEIQAMVTALAPVDAAIPCRYSKKFEGAAMLERLDPTRVERRCRLYFRPVWLELSRMAA